MYKLIVNYMAVPYPKNWVCKFEKFGDARAAAAERYMQPQVHGYRILDENGTVIDGKGVCLIVNKNNR